MADYQEYRRRILRKRWRRTFAAAGLLVLLILLSAVGLLWKHLHREQSPAAVQGPTIFQQELQSSEWNTISTTDFFLSTYDQSFRHCTFFNIT